MFDLFNIFSTFQGNAAFKHRPLLLLLILIPLMAFYYFWQYRRRHATVRMSTLAAFEGGSSIRGRLRILLPILRMLAFGALVVAIARPQMTNTEEKVEAEGVDIFMVMDVSSSMLAKDFPPDRLEASKEVAAEFVDKRKYDRIGLSVFAGEAFTQSPITTDHKVIKEMLAGLRCGILEDGTAIGLGLATAVNRLKDSKSKSKVVILLTDGVNNSGDYVKPMTAAEIASELGIKVYTIGIGSSGDAYAPVRRRGDGRYMFGFVKVEIDEKLLMQIADMTGGQYFRATNKAVLEGIYNYIDQLEKTKIEVTTIKRYDEIFYPWAGLAILLLLLEFILRYSLFRGLP